jgi:hypothetical protein
MSTPPARRKWLWIAATVVVAIGTVAAVTWERLAVVVAIIASERRPALLTDAKWRDPASARMFSSRFPDGVQESELIEWLESNKFTIDKETGRANRLIQSLPCNEVIEVTWWLQADGTIAGAEAKVSEAGCL